MARDGADLLSCRYLVPICDCQSFNVAELVCVTRQTRHRRELGGAPRGGSGGSYRNGGRSLGRSRCLLLPWDRLIAVKSEHYANYSHLFLRQNVSKNPRGYFRSKRMRTAAAVARLFTPRVLRLQGLAGQEYAEAAPDLRWAADWVTSNYRGYVSRGRTPTAGRSHQTHTSLMHGRGLEHGWASLCCSAFFVVCADRCAYVGVRTWVWFVCRPHVSASRNAPRCCGKGAGCV